jgi:hypothetical protein
MIEIVGILLATGNRQHAGAQDVGDAELCTLAEVVRCETEIVRQSVGRFCCQDSFRLIVAI